MNAFHHDSANWVFQATSIPVLAGVLLLPGPVLGQIDAPGWGPGSPETPLVMDGPGSGGECERGRDEDCDPVWAVLGVVLAEYLPQLTDGIRMSYGWMPGGSAYGGRLEWTLHSSQGRRVALGTGMWVAPLRALRPEPADASRRGGPARPSGRDGAVSISVGGSMPIGEGLSARQTIRAVGEATVLVGDPGRQIRLGLGPRYRVPVHSKVLTVDLVAGTNLGASGLAPRVGLRLGLTWD